MSNMLQEYITGQIKDAVLEGGVFTAKAGGESGPEMNAHPGEEIILCLKGTVEVFTPCQKYHLSAGDALHFKSDIPHRWKNSGKTEAQLIWVYTQRTI